MTTLVLEITQGKAEDKKGIRETEERETPMKKERKMMKMSFKKYFPRSCVFVGAGGILSNEL